VQAAIDAHREPLNPPAWVSLDAGVLIAPSRDALIA